MVGLALIGALAAEPIDVLDLDLEDLLEVDTVGSAEGSFGYRLQQSGVVPFLHAYAVGRGYAETGQVPTFDLHYFNVFVGAEIQGVVIPEVQLEYEHGGEILEMRYGQVDIRTPTDALTLRIGKFMVPMGSYNELLYPEFLTPLPDRPLVLREVVPVAWAEVGGQLRGGVTVGEGWKLGYAAYLVNGLEQPDADPDDGVVEEGGELRDMRGNHRDRYAADKAFGFRVGVQGPSGFAAGASGYNGRYTIEASNRLRMYGIDLAWSPGSLLLQAEFFGAQMERTTTEDRRLWGLYGLVGIKLDPHVQPVFQVDLIRPGAERSRDRERYTLGLRFWPYPVKVPFLVFKASGALTTPREGERSGRAVAQMAVGF